MLQDILHTFDVIVRLLVCERGVAGDLLSQHALPAGNIDQVGTMLNLSSWLAFLGLIFLGLGMLTHSAARRVEIHR